MLRTFEEYQSQYRRAVSVLLIDSGDGLVLRAETQNTLVYSVQLTSSTALVAVFVSSALLATMTGEDVRNRKCNPKRQPPYSGLGSKQGTAPMSCNVMTCHVPVSAPSLNLVSLQGITGIRKASYRGSVALPCRSS